ncbi:MAG: hypothetical protein Kow0069_31670 [Promethearchaeota archaeon]
MSLTRVPKEFKRRYVKTHYRVLGRGDHSAIKPCHWMVQRLLTGRESRNCYKGAFGVKSHRCVQNTPALPFCPHRCAFCWRDTKTGTLGVTWPEGLEPDSPGHLVDEMLRHQRNLLEHHLTVEWALASLDEARAALKVLVARRRGVTARQVAEATQMSNRATTRALVYLKNARLAKCQDFVHYALHPEVASRASAADVEALLAERATTPKEVRACHEEALRPNHAAISLAGEPTTYPHLAGFVREFRRRGFTTFVVTNGAFPENLERWDDGDFPSQLYVSVPAFSPESYRLLCKPSLRDGWKRLTTTLDRLATYPTRTVLRVTVLRGFNDTPEAVERYAELIERARPDFVDLKGFTSEAFAVEISRRLGRPEAEPSSWSPKMGDVRAFARALEARGVGRVLAQYPASRDVLLGVAWPEGEQVEIKKP